MWWIADSNRYKHVAVGVLVYIFAFVNAAFMSYNIIGAAEIATVTTLMVGGAGECKDRLWGGKFDVLDLLATVLFGLVADVIIVVLRLVGAL